MTTLYIIRHAEADGNIYRRMHGHYDGFVTTKGYDQIVKLAKRFKNTHFDAVYSSDLFRTSETARAISETHNLPLNTTTSLREIRLGVWEDKPMADVMCDDPDNYRIWFEKPETFQIFGSETYMQIYTRAKAQLDKIVESHPNQTVAVVTHSTVIRALTAMFTYSTMDKVSRIAWCDNTSVQKVCVDENLNYSIEYSNDTSHLESLHNKNKGSWWDELTCGNYLLRFKSAKFPEDLDKADDYYRSSWNTVFNDNSYDSKHIRSRLKHLNAAHPEAVAFATNGNGQELGMIAMDTKAQLIPNSGHIALIYLNEESRGREFGAQLLGHAVSIYRAMGRKWITVRVAKENKRAIRFYEKHAFEQFGAEQSDNTIQLLMRKCIDRTPAIINWK